ncbi:MAG TPA: hypothetical protein VE914_13235 [Candidatus Angelobacter sp.]|nr:hypothetical protein [Candidatus Angelobacter sp.]
MLTSSASPPRIEYRRFRTRSADADWDFFPFGRWGHGYHVNETQRARLLRIQSWIITGGFLPLAAVFIVMDNANPWRIAPLVLAFLAYVVLRPTTQLLYVRRLPSAERPLTKQDMHVFLAHTQTKGEVLRQLILATTGAVGSLVLFAVGLHLAKTTANPSYVWPGIGGTAYVSVTLACRAWEAYCVRRLQGLFKPPALNKS